MKEDIVISADRLGKRYPRVSRSARYGSLRDTLAEGVGTLVRGRLPLSAARETFWALQDASFEIVRGENIGIIGLNGAGKSTLLKILSRIVTPTAGYARVTGRMGALLEVGTGFHPELTGRENTFLYGAILGMSRTEIARKFNAIVDFAEIPDFIDTPVKRYSSGMYVRLAFAVAAHLDPDILLLDEVLAVGDVTFQRKCMDVARQLVQKGSTILFVSHNMFSIKTMCPRILYLRGGRIVFDGATDEGLRLYEADSKLGPAPWFNPPRVPSLIITKVELYGGDGEPRTLFDFGEQMRVRICYRALRPIQRPHFLCSIQRSDQILCCNFSSYYDQFDVPRIGGDGAIELLTPPLKVTSNRYYVTIAVHENDQQLIAGQIGPSFHLRHEIPGYVAGLFHESAQWRIEQSAVNQAELGDEPKMGNISPATINCSCTEG
jgi:lipopolysaccharide transport system ATP-binding protein